MKHSQAKLLKNRSPIGLPFNEFQSMNLGLGLPIAGGSLKSALQRIMIPVEELACTNIQRNLSLNQQHSQRLDAGAITAALTPAREGARIRSDESTEDTAFLQHDVPSPRAALWADRSPADARQWSCLLLANPGGSARIFRLRVPAPYQDTPQA